MSNPPVGQPQILSNSHRESRMNAHQVQDYIDLVIVKSNVLGEHYVARQVEWAVAELEVAQVRQGGPSIIRPVGGKV